jgi:hypothetical protein
MGFLSFFKSKKAESSTYMMEDDYCQIEIIPRSNYEHALKQAYAHAEFGRAHFNGVGFTAIQERETNSFPTTQLSINIQDVEVYLLAHNFQRIQKISYSGGGYINYKEGITRAYGTTAFTLWTEVRNDIIQNFWITGYGSEQEERKSEALETLIFLGNTYNLILVDWNADKVIDLTKPDEVKAYLNEFF